MLGGRWFEFVCVFHLPLGDHVHEFNATQQDAGAAKILESQHGAGTTLDRPMVLFHDIIEILGLTDFDGRLTLGVHGVQSGQIGATFVDGYGFGRAILIDGLLKVPSGRFLAAWLGVIVPSVPTLAL